MLWDGNDKLIGINNFFQKLEAKLYKIQNRVLLSRYRGKTTCNECNGKGIKVTIRRMGPMIQQIQQPCYACNGQGKYADKSKLCKTCSGNGLISNMKKFKININPGLKDQHYEVLKHMGSETKEGLKSHLVIVGNSSINL